MAATHFKIEPGDRVDLSQIDFEGRFALLASGRSHIAAARLQASLEQRLQRMIRANPMRIDYAERLQETIDRYNAGTSSIGAFFQELHDLARSLREVRGTPRREELTEEELGCSIC